MARSSNAAEEFDFDHPAEFFEDWRPEFDFNAAAEPERTPYEQPVEIPEEEKQPHIHVLPVSEPRPRQKREPLRFVFLLSVLTLLLGALGIVTMYSEIYSKESTVSALEEELEALQTEIAVAEAEASVSEETLDDLYTYATDELGMEEADGSNTVLIQLPAQSYTEVAADSKTTTSKVRFHWFS